MAPATVVSRQLHRRQTVGYLPAASVVPNQADSPSLSTDIIVVLVVIFSLLLLLCVWGAINYAFSLPPKPQGRRSRRSNRRTPSHTGTQRLSSHRFSPDVGDVFGQNPHHRSPGRGFGNTQNDIRVHDRQAEQPLPYGQHFHGQYTGSHSRGRAPSRERPSRSRTRIRQPPSMHQPASHFPLHRAQSPHSTPEAPLYTRRVYPYPTPQGSPRIMPDPRDISGVSNDEDLARSHHERQLGDAGSPPTQCWPDSGSRVARISADPPNHYEFEAGDTSPIEEARAEGRHDDETMLSSPSRRHSNTGDGPPNVSEQLSPWHADTDPNPRADGQPEPNALIDRPEIDSSSFLESRYEEPFGGDVDGGDAVEEEDQMDREWEARYHTEADLIDQTW